MNQTTLDQLRSLKLSGFLNALIQQQESSQYHSLSFEERLALLLDSECSRRDAQRLKRRIKTAGFTQSAALDAVDFETPRKLDRATFLSLAQCSWVTRSHNLIITGPTGVGKTFIITALANECCKRSLNVLYTKLSDIIADLALARHDGSFRTLLKKLRSFPLLIIDEFLRTPLVSQDQQLLLDLIDSRFRNASTLIISQLPVKDWFEHLPDSTSAEAILDRIVHDSLRLELNGDSMRKKTSPLPAH